MTRAALWLLLGACPAGAADLPDPAAVEAEWRRLAERQEAALAEMKAVRLAFPGRDPEAGIRRWEALEKEYGAFTKAEQDLRGKYDYLLKEVLFVQMAGGLLKAKAGKDRDTSREALTSGMLDAKEAMRTKALMLSTSHNDELGRFLPTLKAYRDGKAESRRWVLLTAAGAVLLAAGGYVYTRAGVPSPPSVPPPAAAAPPPPRTVAGNFTVVRALGRGSLGEVYEAVDKTLDRRTALKRLRPELLQDPRELERLLAEARVMAALKHPNMVAIYGVERDAGQVYLALEFVDGGTLESRLGREGRLGFDEALRVLDGAAAAVDYCHGHKVIHRDLKPANIMLSCAGAVKVTDFSVSYQAAQSVSRLTRQPSWGTPPYMAPEQELGELSGSVDVYALGVCFYEMLTGELPFVGPNFLAQKRESAWVPPRRLVPGLPRGTDDLFAIALAPEPPRRFQSAGALAAAARALTA